MASLDMQPIPVRTGSKDKEGRLVLFEGELIAVLVRLDDDMHGDNRGQWFLDAVFVSKLTRDDPFPTLAEVETWVRQKLATNVNRP